MTGIAGCQCAASGRAAEKRTSVEGINTKTKLNTRLFFHLPSLDHMG